MTTEVVTIDKDDTYGEVVRKLVENKITGAPVLDSNDYLIGIVTEFDLSHILFALNDVLEDGFTGNGSGTKNEKLTEAMNREISDFIIKDVHTVSPDTTLMEAGRIMLVNDIDRMPVMKGDKIIGIIGRRKLFRHIFKENLNF